MPLVEDLCGQVLGFDAGGRQLTLPELQALAQAERAARA
jgi:hypothetical protein